MSADFRTRVATPPVAGVGPWLTPVSYSGNQVANLSEINCGTPWTSWIMVYWYWAAKFLWNLYFLCRCGLSSVLRALAFHEAVLKRLAPHFQSDRHGSEPKYLTAPVLGGIGHRFDDVLPGEVGGAEAFVVEFELVL